MNRDRRMRVLGTWLVLAGFCGLMLLLWASFGPGQVGAQSLLWPSPPYSPANISFSSSGDNTIVSAPTAGGTCVYGLTLTNASTTTATTVQIKDGATVRWSAFLQFNGGSAFWSLINGNPKNPYFITAAGNNFVVNSSAAVQINGGVYAANCP